MSISKQKDYYSKLVDGSSGNQRSLFKVVEEMLDRKSERVLPEHTDPVELANEFNRYYVKKIEKLRETIPKDVNIQGVLRKKFEGERLYEFAPTSEEEVLQMVKKYGVKASAEDPLPTEVLKVVVKDLLPLFTSLVNKSFSEGTMEGIKHSAIDPLLKKADLDVEIYKNFRPVNNLVFLSKLIERLASKRMDSHLRKNNLHNKKQFAYKEFHSTETMMVGVTSDVLKG